MGGVGIVAWVVLARPFGLGGDGIPTITGPFMWLLLAITGTHFGISYHLAYGQGRAEVRRNWPALVGVPAALGVVSFAVVVAAVLGAGGLAVLGVRLLLVSVFTLTGWHYVKQAYGVARVGASLGGLPLDRASTRVLRYGLYPLWFLNASIVWTRGYRPASYGFAGGFEVFPPITERALEVVAVVSLVVVGGAFVRLAVHARTLPPATMWTPYLVAYLFFVWTPGHVSTFLVLGALHGLQYLVCAHRAEVSWGAERREPRPVVWWATVFGTALATGMLLSYWLPMWLGGAMASTAAGPLVAVLLFAYFNLHHYAVDAVMWRSGGGHVRRIVKGPA
ncbi:hypothetical protein [Rhabdothermincola salaria]|uniref:hypothetical protein n=1 Tax=Rhabdothermincola salaria TaxID=2903142 RepID=UPI001E5DAAD1|nr:hypothetical protein [Rhabdothermincola salaria]MCD9625415.1 hypothetical protein [Rhabdothermincola salaria]